MNLSDSPRRPACPSRASGWSSLTTPWGLPCCVRFPCVHAVATTPAQPLVILRRSFVQWYQPSPVWQPGRPAHRPFRGLLGVHSRYGLHTRAVTVFRDTLNRRLQPFRYLHDCSGCFRLERLPGGTCTHWKSAALSRRTPKADIACPPVHHVQRTRPRSPARRFARPALQSPESIHEWPRGQRPRYLRAHSLSS